MFVQAQHLPESVRSALQLDWPSQPAAYKRDLRVRRMHCSRKRALTAACVTCAMLDDSAGMGTVMSGQIEQDACPIERIPLREQLLGRFAGTPSTWPSTLHIAPGVQDTFSKIV